MLRVEFWQSRYDAGELPWDLGQASAHFADLLQNPPDFLKPGKMAVLGSGQGHDAALFAQAGFEVVGFDYAPGAIERSRQLYGDKARFEQVDLFTLAEPNSPWAREFDYVLEHTCFCAIFPEDRPAYVRSARNILKSGGYLMGVFWEHGDTDGPPFSTTQAQIREAFEPDFEVCAIEARQPVPGRSGIERRVMMKRR